MTQQASPLGNPSSASAQGRDPHPPARAAGLKLVAGVALIAVLPLAGAVYVRRTLV